MQVLSRQVRDQVHGHADLAVVSQIGRLRELIVWLSESVPHSPKWRYLYNNKCVTAAECPKNSKHDPVSGSCLRCRIEGCNPWMVMNLSDRYACFEWKWMSKEDGTCMLKSACLKDPTMQADFVRGEQVADSAAHSTTLTPQRR